MQNKIYKFSKTFIFYSKFSSKKLSTKIIPKFSSWFQLSSSICWESEQIEFSPLSFCFNSIHELFRYCKRKAKINNFLVRFKNLTKPKSEKGTKMRRLLRIKCWWVFFLFFRCISGSIFKIQKTETPKVHTNRLLACLFLFLIKNQILFHVCVQ